MGNTQILWDKLAIQIIRFRVFWLFFLTVVTLFFAYFSQKLTLSYESYKVVPTHDPDMIFFDDFLKTFGEEGNLLAIGLRDSSVFELNNFKKLIQFNQKVGKLQGIKEVISLPNLQYLHKDTTQKVFAVKKLFEQIPNTQAQLDTLLNFAKNIKFYEGQIINPKNGALLLILAIDKKVLNSVNRLKLIENIKNIGNTFSKSTQIKLYYAGLPYVRTIMATRVRSELQTFLVISLLVTVLVVFLFFRNIIPVLVSVSLIGISVVWCIGTMGLLGYKINILSGLIPPILVIIAIPNSIYLITKYHQEYIASGNKHYSLKKVISKIGFVTIIANITTAIGFFVFIIGDVTILKEFGIVTGISTLYTMLVSMLLVPIAYYYLPAPSEKELKHLEMKGMNSLITGLIVLAQKHQLKTYLLTLFITLISIWGIYKIQVLAFLVDDLPKDNDIKRDLAFFEQNFKGVMPLEIIIDTGKKKGSRRLKTLALVDTLENYLATLPQVAKPISMVDFMKTATQSYFNNNTDYFRLPEKNEMPFVLGYLKNQKDEKNLMRSFLDKEGKKIRLSLKVADIGSIRMDSLIKYKIKPAIQRIFKDTDLKVGITGSSYLFIKGNDYLVDSLKSGIWTALLFVGLAHGLLFTNLRIIIISLIPSIIPMIITAGLMGFLGIPLKPSTAIVFSIVFGITVDNTVHFLARYKLELDICQDVLKATIISIKETSHGMIYTSLVLFAGFFIFVASQFGGTVALGILTSTTLLIALATNLTLLPILLINFDYVKKIDKNKQI